MELTLAWTGIAVASLALFLGCTVYSATGFGIAMVATPITLLAIADPQTAVIVVNSAGASAGVLIAIQARKDVPYREIVPIAAAGALGVPVGVAILKFADPNIIRIGIAVLILLLAALSFKEFRGEIPYARGLGTVAGFVVGVTLAAFAVGGPLIVLFLLVISMVGLGFYTYFELYTAERLTLIAIVLVPAFIGFALGGLLIKQMNERIFRYVVLGIIAMSSMAVLLPEVRKMAQAWT